MPLQWPSWGRDSLGDYVLTASVTAILCLILNALWFTIVKAPVLEARVYQKDKASSPRSQDASCFVNLVMCTPFAFNWIWIYCVDVPSPLSMSVQAGLCAGLEIYMTLMECAQLMSGSVRMDMMVHHGCCLAFIGATTICYASVPDADLEPWHIAWDSISRYATSLPLRQKGTTCACAHGGEVFLKTCSRNQYSQSQATRSHPACALPSPFAVLPLWQDVDVHRPLAAAVLFYQQPSSQLCLRWQLPLLSHPRTVAVCYRVRSQGVHAGDHVQQWIGWNGHHVLVCGN
mgnify:CR=1 FL=1